MQTWYRKNLGDAMLAAPELDRIAAQLERARHQDEADQDMAAFQRHESEGRLHCEVVVYFSPAAAHIARALGATRCARPMPGDLGMVAGAEDAARRWFAKI